MKVKLVWAHIPMIIFFYLQISEKIQRGDRGVYSLINRPEHKFEGSVIIAGGFIL